MTQRPVHNPRVSGPQTMALDVQTISAMVKRVIPRRTGPRYKGKGPIATWCAATGHSMSWLAKQLDGAASRTALQWYDRTDEFAHAVPKSIAAALARISEGGIDAFSFAGGIRGMAHTAAQLANAHSLGLRRRRNPTHPMYAYVDSQGTTVQKWASEHGLSSVLIGYWINGRRTIPQEQAEHISVLTGRAVPVFAWHGHKRTPKPRAPDSVAYLLQAATDLINAARSRLVRS